MTQQKNDVNIVEEQNQQLNYRNAVSRHTN